MVAHRWLLVSPRRDAHRRLLADGQATRGRLDPGAGRADIPGQGLGQSEVPWLRSTGACFTAAGIVRRPALWWLVPVPPRRSAVNPARPGRECVE